MTNKYLNYIIFWFLLLPSTSMGQTMDELLKNPDIGWVAEIENDWVVDQTGLIDTFTEVNYANLLKWIQPTDLKGTNRDEMMWRILLERVIYNKTPVFKNAQCTVPFDWNDLIVRDTSPCTGEAVSWTKTPEISDFLYLRLHQLIYYDTKKVAFGCAAASVAIIIKDPKQQSKDARGIPFCWFKTETKAPKNYISDKRIILAIQTWARSDKNLLNIQNTQTRKTSNPTFDLVAHLFEALVKPDKKHSTFCNNDNLFWQPLTLDQRRKIIAWQDTIEQYDYSTEKSTLAIEKHQILPTHICELRLAHTWYWDDKRRRLTVHLDAVAPMFNVTDDAGNFRYKKPLFYVLTN